MGDYSPGLKNLIDNLQDLRPHSGRTVTRGIVPCPKCLQPAALVYADMGMTAVCIQCKRVTPMIGNVDKSRDV